MSLEAVEPDVAPVVLQKPLLRGVFHQFGAAIAAGAGAVLVAIAPAGRPTLATVVYALSLFALFTISATYHRVDWSARGRIWMRRADHAAIFVLIAGTYTPIAMLALSPEVANRLLLLTWGGAVLGILKSLFWVQAPKPVIAILAVAVGWSLVPCMGEVRRAYGEHVFALIIGGGVAYSVGAVAYALKRPSLRPSVFGYHEVFHVLTLVGATLHFDAVLRMVRALG
jgi:hemolysin III